MLNGASASFLGCFSRVFENFNQEIAKFASIPKIGEQFQYLTWMSISKHVKKNWNRTQKY
jgi:hypothetical protein